MYNFFGASRRMDIVVLILFLVFFVDPLLPNKLVHAVRNLFLVQKAKSEKKED
jgi:hypothetical protein